MHPLIEVKQLDLVLKHRQILTDINLVVHEQQTVGLIGPNGSGKSSLLKTIYRVYQKAQGEIFIQGINQSELTLKQQAQRVAVVEQNNLMNFDLTVEDLILMGRNPYKGIFEGNTALDYQVCQEAIQMVGLEGYEHRKLSTLSGGEHQRIIIARAIAQETHSLLLDEPTNHLDIKYQIDVLKLIKTLGKATLISLHDLNLASLYCDYLYVMKNGEIVAEGTPETIITEAIIKKVYEIDVKVIQIEGVPRVLYS